MPPLVVKQCILMKKALRIVDDIETIVRTFEQEDVLVNLKIGNLQDEFAYTMAELTRLMLNIEIPSR